MPNSRLQLKSNFVPGVTAFRLARGIRHAGRQGNPVSGRVLFFRMGAPLHSAALSGSPANVQALLDAGADVMARTTTGSTPLHGAGNPEVIQALLNAGADVMARNILGSTPLHLAARRVFPDNIIALLDVGADAKAKDKEGKTPWNYAQENEKLKGTKAYWASNEAQYN